MLITSIKRVNSIKFNENELPVHKYRWVEQPSKIQHENKYPNFDKRDTIQKKW